MKSKTSRLKLIDIIIAVVWISIIFILFMVFLSGNSRITLSETKTIHISAYVDNIPDDHIDLIKKNDIVTLLNTDAEIGKIESVNYFKSYVHAYDENNNEVNKHIYPDIYDISLNIEGTATIKNKEITINGNILKVSEKIECAVPNFIFECTITDIEVIE